MHDVAKSVRVHGGCAMNYSWKAVGEHVGRCVCGQPPGADMEVTDQRCILPARADPSLDCILRLELMRVDEGLGFGSDEPRERIYIERTASNRKRKVSREGSKW